MSDPYLGEIRMFGGNFAPIYWHVCDGSLLPISEYDALFTLLGTIYGGDGQVTFGLPDLRGRIPVHAGLTTGSMPGRTPRALGQSGGAEQVTLTTAQLPAHTHVPSVSGTSGTSTSPAGRVWAAAPGSAPYADPSAPTAPMASAALSQAGSSFPHDNMPPYLGVNFIIALFGIYPPQP